MNEWLEKSVSSPEHMRAMERVTTFLWSIATWGSLGVVLYLILYGLYAASTMGSGSG